MRASRRRRARVASGGTRPLPPIETRTIHLRMRVVAVLLGAMFVVAAARAVVLQTVEAPALLREAARNYVRSETLDDWRGDVVDRNGRLLGITVHRWALTADPKEVKDPRRAAELLAPIAGVSEAEVRRRLDPASAVDPDDLRPTHPARQLARQLSAPMLAMLGDVFGTPRQALDVRLDLLEKFMQLEQLKTPAVFPVVDLLADAAQRTADALAADLEDLRFFPTGGRRFTYLARDLDDAAVKRLSAARDAELDRCREAREARLPCVNALSAIWVRPEPRRYYPKRDLASQLLGLVGRDGEGLSGIERAFDALLAGGLHRAPVVKDQRGRRIFLDGLPPEAQLLANTVELTIDQHIQSLAERELSRACLASGARAGYAIVVRPKTGEVLAVANFPSYNPNNAQEWFRDQAPIREERASLQQRRRDLAWAATWGLNARTWGDPKRVEAVEKEHVAALEQATDAFVEMQHGHPNTSRNTAFLDVYEPGSIMKVFTVAAGLEAGVVSPGTVFDLEGGDWEVGDADGSVIHDVSRQRAGNLALILKKSSNIGAAKIAFLLGAERLENTLRAFGFGGTTGSGFPGEARGLLRPSTSWVPIELANVSFGQGMAATGLQLVMGLAALANEGRLMRPLLVSRVLDGEGRTLHAFAPEVVREAVRPKTAKAVLKLMESVVEPDGTGRRAYIPEYPVAGKTGTGQKPHLRRRGYAEDMWVNTFFGVAPVEAPELAVVVLVDEPKGKQHGGGLIAAPAFRGIMEGSLAYLGVPSPFSTSRRPIWLDPATLTDRRALEHEAAPPASDRLAELVPTVAPASDGTLPVPDFHGLTMREVRLLASRVGLRVRYLGSGVASAQDVPPNARVAAEREVTVSFASRLPGAHLARTDGTPTSSSLGAMPSVQALLQGTLDSDRGPGAARLVGAAVGGPPLPPPPGSLPSGPSPAGSAPGSSASAPAPEVQ
jgi:cell division protein FtsI/penicillin-binding protein 2